MDKIVGGFSIKRGWMHCFVAKKETGKVTPSYINAYTCAQDLFIRGLLTL